MRRLYPNTPAVFCDTGLEYPEVRAFALKQDNVTVLHPIKYNRKTRKYDRISFRQVIGEEGYPIVSKEVANVVREAQKAVPGGRYAYRLARLEGTLLDNHGNLSQFNCPKWKFLKDAPFKVSEQCCNIMKKTPFRQFERETGMHGILGVMASEGQLRRQQWVRNGCNIFEGKKIQSKPLSFWTEQDVLNYIQKYHLEIASVYGDIVQDEKSGKLKTTQCNRTGCVFCGFGCHLEKEPNRFQMLKQTHPQLWEYCMKPWDEGGLGMKEVLDYINVKTE